MEDTQFKQTRDFVVKEIERKKRQLQQIAQELKVLEEVRDQMIHIATLRGEK